MEYEDEEEEEEREYHFEDSSVPQMIMASSKNGRERTNESTVSA